MFRAPHPLLRASQVCRVQISYPDSLRLPGDPCSVGKQR